MLTRNGVRLLGSDVVAAELHHARAVYGALLRRYREVRQDHWWSFEALSQATGLTRVQAAIGFVLLLADVNHPGRGQLDPLLGYPREFAVDLALVKAKPKWELDVYELLTPHQYHRLQWEQATAAAEKATREVPEGAPTSAPSGEPTKPEPKLPPDRRGAGKRRRLSAKDLVAPLREEFRRRWRLGEFDTAKEGHLAVQKRINREGDFVYEEGDAGYKKYDNIRARTSDWFPKEEKGADARPTPSDKR